MVTSEDEHCSLMSPVRSNSLSVAEHFTDITPLTPLTSEEAQSYQELAETNIALGESINVGHFIPYLVVALPFSGSCDHIVFSFTSREWRWA